MPEIVYVFTNPAMLGYVKIGKTSQTDVKQRLKTLSNTGVPMPFECPYAAKVDDATKVETTIHRILEPYRPNKKREFFKIDHELIIDLIKLIAIGDATPETKKILDEITSPADRKVLLITKAKTRKSVDRLKARGWQGIVEGIGTRNPNPELKKFRRQMLNNPPTKENANDLRAIIANAPKGVHSHRLIALRELVDEAESTTQN